MFSNFWRRGRHALFIIALQSGLYCLIMSKGSYKSIAGSDQHLPAAKERGGDGGGRPAVDSPSQVRTTTSYFHHIIIIM